MSFSCCPHGLSSFRSPTEGSFGLPPLAQPFRRLQARFLWIALADSGGSLSVNDIPPLPISHGLEYPLGSRMHLGVVHPRLEARGRPFPRSPRSRSRVNLRVLEPLTRGPRGNPHPCGHLTAVPVFRAFSRLPVARLPMVGPWFTTPWRLVSHPHGAVAWRFRPPIPPHVPFPFTRSCHRPNPRVPWFPAPMGPLCGPCHTPVLAPCPHHIPHPVFLPYRAASNPVARAHSILIHPGTVLCSSHGLLLSTPLLPRNRRVLLRTFLSGSSGHFSHVMAPLAHLCIGTRTQRVQAAVAQQGCHYTYPHWALEGSCVLCSVCLHRLLSCRP